MARKILGVLVSKMVVVKWGHKAGSLEGRGCIADVGFHFAMTRITHAEMSSLHKQESGAG